MNESVLLNYFQMEVF